MDSWYGVVGDFLSSSPWAVGIAALIISGSAVGCYFQWFYPATTRLETSLRAVADAIDASASDGWITVKARVREVLAPSPGILAAWKETEERVIPLPLGERTLNVMFGAPRDIWSEVRLLSRSINLPLAESVPNLLVGVGLLFTFFFLTVALTEATAALGVQGSAKDVSLTAATAGLLKTAGAKFLTSLAGLLASILWTVAARRRMARLHAAAEDVLDRLGHIVPFGGGEMTLFAHLQIARELHQGSLAHSQISGGVAKSVNQQLEVAEELLEEARDQTGTFKRFETDLAVTLANAITNAFSPQMQSMTDKLTGAIDALSEKMGAMNQEALQRMMDDFAAMLKKSTESEMAQLKETLAVLARRLEEGGVRLGEGVKGAAEDLDKAGRELLARVEQVAQNLGKGAANLEGAVQGVKEGMNDLDVTIRDATRLGQQGAAFIRQALQDADAVFVRLGAVATELGTTGEALENVGGSIVDAVDKVQELTDEQRAVVNAVKQATPEAMIAIRNVLEVLRGTIDQTTSLMSQTRDALTATGRALGTTVAEITAGVSEYSKTVAELHIAMDSGLSTAITSLDKGVEDLHDAVEELGEILTTRVPGN